MLVTSAQNGKPPNTTHQDIKTVLTYHKPIFFSMSYQSGMNAYKTGNYQQAIDAFHSVIESDEQNHKAWNALGVQRKQCSPAPSRGRCPR